MSPIRHSAHEKTHSFATYNRNMSAEKKNAYKEQLPKIPPMRERILDMLRLSGEMGASVSEISNHLHIKQSTVTGRLDELMDMGVVHSKEFERTSTRYFASHPLFFGMFAKSRKIYKMRILLNRCKAMFPNVTETLWEEMENEIHAFTKQQ